MSPNNNLNYNNFKLTATITLFMAAIIFFFSFYLGKEEFFLLLNGDGGPLTDLFFKYITYLGDGALWVVWLVVFLVTKRYRLLPVIIAAFSFTTILTQVCKQLILPGAMRPSKAIANSLLIHFVDGVSVHSSNSFPSGHTGTAFTFALLLALFVRNQTLAVIFLFLALLAGYSRIYLAQHFPLDAGAGMVVAVVSVSLALMVQKKFDKVYPLKL